MKRRYPYGVVALLALLAVTYPVIYSAYAGTISSNAPFTCPPLIPCDNSKPVSETCTSFCVVDIQNSAFQPSVINATQNAVIEFVNLDPNPHTTTEIYNNAWNSGFIDPGAHFMLNISSLSPGTYYFACEIHPFMTGQINVLPANATV